MTDKRPSIIEYLLNKMDGPKVRQRSKFKVKHQKRKLFRANEPFFSVFMWGVNYSVVEVSHANVPVMLLPDDFKAHMKVKVDLQHFNQDIMPSHYKFKVYCPLVFRAFRDIFAVSDRQWKYSLTTKQLTPSTSREKTWVSHDRKFLIKALSSEDVANLHAVIQDLHKHYIETRGNTLLPKFVGLFRTCVEDKNAYLMVSKHIFDADLRLHEIFLIKGSTVDRHANEKESQLNPPILKDNDLLDANRSIFIGGEAKRVFLEKLKKDVEFLSSQNIMDYSLMIGIHDCTAPTVHRSPSNDCHSSQTMPPLGVNNNNNNNNNNDACSPFDDSDMDAEDLSSPEIRYSENPLDLDSISRHDSIGEKQEIYFIGLTDILTFYGTRKKTYHFAKTAKYGAEAEISNVKPEQYAKRMLDFVERILI